MRRSFSITLLLTLLPLFTASQPLHQEPFTQKSFLADRFLNFPVGELKAPAGEIALVPIGSTFSEAYRIDLKSGEAALFASKEAVETEGKAYAVTLEYIILEGDAEVAVVAFNAPEGVPDGQLAYTQVLDHQEVTAGQTRRLHVVSSPPSEKLSVGVQVSLAHNAHPQASIVLHSLSVYPFDPQQNQPVATNPGGTFTVEPQNIIKNINNDAGEVFYDAITPAMRLQTAGEGQSANIAFTIDRLDAAPESLLYAHTTLSRIREDDGITAFVLLNETWSAGSFIANNQLKKLPEKTEVTLAASMPGTVGNMRVVVQNGGSQVESINAVHEVRIETVVEQSIGGLLELEEIDLPQSLAAAVFLPKNLYSNSQGSFSLTTLDLNSHRPVSVPFTVLLQGATQAFSLGQGITNAHGFSAKNFTLGDLSGGSWKVNVQTYGKSLLSGQATLKQGGVLFIETDKPIYKPGQRIQGRVVLLNNALTPLQNEVELSISDGKGIKIHRETLTTNEYGVAAFELPLASELNFGTWKMQAKIGTEIQVERDIEVDRYVLPSFEISLNLEKDWFLVNERITGGIESRYFFGKPVQGEIIIEALRYVGTWETYATQSGRLEEGLFSLDLPPVQYVAGTPAQAGAGTLQLKITVTDDTGHAEKTDLLAKIVDSEVTIKLIPESSVVKPGLSQELLIVTTTPGGAPLSGNVDMEVLFFSQGGIELGSKNETVATQNGLATLMFDVPQNTTVATVSAKSKITGTSTKEEYLILPAAYSPGAHFIHLRQIGEGVLQVGQMAEFHLFANGDATVFYDVYASGRTVFSSFTEGDTIRFAVTPEMSPKAQVVAYMIQENNEISADVLPFDVEIHAPASLNVSFNAEEVKPGDPVTLSVQTGGAAMVGLALVDESVFALAKGRLNLRNVFAELERIYMQPQIEIHIDPNPWITPPEIGGKGSGDILRDHQLQVIASEGLIVPQAEPMDPWIFWNNPIRKNLPPFLFPVLEEVDQATGGGGGGSQYQEPDRVRTFFPETWLWRPDLLTDEQGIAVLDLTAPDSITTWRLHALSTSQQGMGIAEGSLRVFQDFFADPDLPYAVTRGDRFPLIVRLFNYVDQEQQIQVTLEDAEGLGLQDDNVKEVTLPANGLASVSFTLQPDRVGLIPVSIVARGTQRADAIRKDLRVEPEGVRQEIVHNGILKGATEVIHSVTFAEEVVSDSQKLRVSITPSLIAQSMNGIDDLLGMPYGCGEQNMIFLAPDIEILRYLKLSGQLMPELRAKVEFFITTGYQRELTFQRSDGSFSAFGEQDESGSLWLTAFVLSTFSSAREVRTIDADVLAKAADWILSHQKADGSWEPVGFLIHQELSGGLNGDMALTAFVTLSLLEYGQADTGAVNKALDYLEQNRTSKEVDSYVLSMITYALTRANRASAGNALDMLMQQALRDRHGIYWQPHDIEATAYAALSLMAHSRPEANAALEWIAAQRNSLGGYGSTQDTVVAFKAMAEAAAMQSRGLNATVRIFTGGELFHSFTVDEANFDVLQTAELPLVPEVRIEMEGTGTVTYQLAQIFNLPVRDLPIITDDLQLSVEYSAEHIQTDDIVDVNVKVLYAGEFQETGMTILDVSIPTGFELVAQSLERVREMDVIKRIEQAGRKVIFYIDHLTLGETLEFGFQVKAKYPVKADGGTSTAYLYYDPNTRAEVQSPELLVE